MFNQKGRSSEEQAIIEQEYLQLTLNLGELYFMTGLMEDACSEFINVLNQLEKKGASPIHFAIAYELYIYSMTYITPPSFYNKLSKQYDKFIKTFQESDLFNHNKNKSYLDIVDCFRITTVIELLLKIGNYYGLSRINEIE